MLCATCCQAGGGESEVVLVDQAGSGEADTLRATRKRPVDAAPGAEDDSLRSPRPPEAAAEGSREESPDDVAQVADPSQAAPTWGGKLTESSVFVAVVAKGDRKLNMDINFHDNTTLLVTRVKPGPCDDYNQANFGKEISPGDRIVSVNGVTGDSQQMVNACKGAAELKLTIRRSEEMTMKLAKTSPDQILGMDLELCDTMTVVITNIDDGANSITAEHNRQAPDFRIEKDYRIIGVNGVRGNAENILEALQGASAWELTVRQVWPK